MRRWKINSDGRATNQDGEKVLRKDENLPLNKPQNAQLTLRRNSAEVRSELSLRRLVPRQACRPKHRDFAVDDCLLGADRFRSADDGGKLFRPAQALARMKRDVVAVDAKLKAVAVILDFMNPFRTHWRFFAKRRIARLDIARKFRFCQAAYT